MKIFNSVGFNCVNDPKDVAVVKHLLNSEITNIIFNYVGFYSKEIVSDIKEFQKEIMRQSRPTGQIFPDDNTFSKLLLANSIHPKYYVLSRHEDPVITPAIQIRIDEVSEQFFAYTGKILTITSGYRGPERQAKAMFDKVNDTHGANNGDDRTFNEIVKKSYLSYVKWADAKEIYDDMVESRKKYINTTTKQITDASLYAKDAIQKMAATISKQVANGSYISKHLTNKAFDCSIRGLSGADIHTLKTLVKKLGGTTPDEKTGTPHIHIQF